MRGITTPRNIIHKDVIYNNPQKICNIANKYYINTIREFWNKIPNIPVTPIEILKNIYPRAQSEFTIPIPTIADITQIIKLSKCKHSTGHDNISMNMLKKTTTIMAPLITHLTTHIILSRKFPDIFKINRITPKHKKGKPIYNIGSF